MINYMNDFGIRALEIKRDIEIRKEEDDFEAHTVTNTIIIGETTRTIAKIYEVDAANGMFLYMYVYSYFMYVYVYVIHV
jgi:hypothetical protein